MPTAPRRPHFRDGGPPLLQRPGRIETQFLLKAHRDPLTAFAIQVKTVQRVLLPQFPCGVDKLPQVNEMNARPIDGKRPDDSVKQLDIPAGRSVSRRIVRRHPALVQALVHGQYRQ